MSKNWKQPRVEAAEEIPLLADGLPGVVSGAISFFRTTHRRTGSIGERLLVVEDKGSSTGLRIIGREDIHDWDQRAQTERRVLSMMGHQYEMEGD